MSLKGSLHFKREKGIIFFTKEKEWFVLVRAFFCLLVSYVFFLFRKFLA